MKRRPWTTAEVNVLRWAYPDQPTPVVARMLGRTLSQVYGAACSRGIKKSEAYIAAELQRQGEQLRERGKMGRFAPGLIPWNAGTRGVSGNHPNTRRTQFKAGEMHGQAQHNYKPIGSLRISKDGYLERKVTDDHPVPARRWVGVHRLVWESVNGPVPDSHAVCFLPGMRTAVEAEITIDRLELVTRAQLMQRNTRHRLPKEISNLIQLRAAVTRQINRRRVKRGPIPHRSQTT